MIRAGGRRWSRDCCSDDSHEKSRDKSAHRGAEKGTSSDHPCSVRKPAAMPPASTPYTLVGFSPELDWRPLCFVKPIPPNRVCSACGLVRKVTAWLPCMHVLCESCCEQCADEGLRVCPLDGYECQDEDIDWKDFPADQLLKREVKCWNEERGCEATTAASDISTHFQRACGHHFVSCPKCSAGVLIRNVCSHLKSGCQTGVTRYESEDELLRGNKDDKSFFTSLQAALERQAAESRDYLERMAVDTATHSDRINELTHGMNTLKESLKEEIVTGRKQNTDIMAKSVRDITVSNKEVKTFLTTLKDAMNTVSASISTLEKTLTDRINNGTTGTRDRLSQVATEIRTEVKENTQTTVEKIREFLGHPQLQEAFSIFSVKDVKALEEKAQQTGNAEYTIEKVYLLGYCISPGVHIRKVDGSIKLHVLFRLYKGDMDDFLHWPFQHKIRLSCVHPKHGLKLVMQAKGNYTAEYFQKPTQPQNRYCYFSGESLDLKVIFTEGYVENDSLSVKWELIPPAAVE